MLPFSEALARLVGSAIPLGAERVPLDEAAGRVLAEDIPALTAMPPFDYSSMDGYALASSDLSGSGPFVLPVAGESAAGGRGKRSPSQSEAPSATVMSTSEAR